jgi:hypothetical protein
MSTWDDKPNDYEHAIEVIKRLRLYIKDLQINSPAQAALDEIGRLREARDDAEGRYSAVYAAKCLVDAEVGRLKAGIKEYACTGTDHPCGCYAEFVRDTAEVERLRHELSEDGVTARRRMRDDIEWLRADVIALEHDLDSYMKAANEYLNEVERLRAAIETALRGFRLCSEFAPVIDELERTLSGPAEG